jgi:hypothetical protein
MNKKLTDEASEFLSDNNLIIFESPNEYINYILRFTNLHDAITMIDKLGEAIPDYTLSQDQLLVIGNDEDVFVDIEKQLKSLDYEGTIWEDEEL